MSKGHMSEPTQLTNREQVPEGFIELTLTIRFSPGDLNFERLFADFSSQQGSSARSDKGGIRGVLRGKKRWGKMHAHFTLEHSKENDGDILELELTSKGHGKFPEGIATVTQFLRKVRNAHRQSDVQLSAIIGAHFSLSSSSWIPTVPLPLTPPDKLDHIPGAPKISGLDFSFSDSDPNRTLLRAFVTTYDAINEMVVRILWSEHVALADDVLEKMVKVASDYLPAFAAKREVE